MSTRPRNVSLSVRWDTPRYIRIHITTQSGPKSRWPCCPLEFRAAHSSNLCSLTTRACTHNSGAADVRYAPDSGTKADIAHGPSCANRRHLHKTTISVEVLVAPAYR